jgi:hypothetical protein
VDLMAQAVAVSLTWVLHSSMPQSSVPPEREVPLTGRRNENVLGREEGALEVIENGPQSRNVVDDLLGTVSGVLEEELASDDAMNLESLGAVEGVGPKLLSEARISIVELKGKVEREVKRPTRG